MSDDPVQRRRWTVQHEQVRMVTPPTKVRPPTLGHLRRFVAACEGLADDLPVEIEQATYREGGFSPVVINVATRESTDDA